jgi:hypothetical protein
MSAFQLLFPADTVIGAPGFYHSAINHSARLFNHGWTRMDTDHF